MLKKVGHAGAAFSTMVECSCSQNVLETATLWYLYKYYPDQLPVTSNALFPLLMERHAGTYSIWPCLYLPLYTIQLQSMANECNTLHIVLNSHFLSMMCCQLVSMGCSEFKHCESYSLECYATHPGTLKYGT